MGYFNNLRNVIRSKKRVLLFCVCSYIAVVLLFEGHRSQFTKFGPRNTLPLLNFDKTNDSYPPLFKFGLPNIGYYLSYSKVGKKGIRNTTAIPQNEKRNRGNIVSSRAVDIHIESPGNGHTGETVHAHTIASHLDPEEAKKTIAIGGGITSAKLKSLTKDTIKSKFPFFQTLLPSFCETASLGFHYHFYLAYDYNDPYFSHTSGVQDFQNAFYEGVRQMMSPKFLNVSIHFIQCSHSKQPARAQNDAMMEAYIDDMEYYYRVNDDSRLRTSKWTESFIDVLSKYNPVNVGVVGPKHRGGNTAILTYDFVHKTHVDIFGFYYPKLFTDWWADDWITKVYRPDRSTKVEKIAVWHTMSQGRRYNWTPIVGTQLGGRVKQDQVTLTRYIKYRETKDLPKATGRKIISLYLYGKNTNLTYGAIRNAQLTPVMFPGWNLRIYTSTPDSRTNLTVPERILRKLQSLGVLIYFVDPAIASKVPPQYWSHLAADDKNIDYFIVRDPRTRLSDRDHATVTEFLNSGKTFHSIKDHPKHANSVVLGGLWGAQQKSFSSALGSSMKDLLLKHHAETLSETFLHQVIWPKVINNVIIHNSIACTNITRDKPIIALRQAREYIGQTFDAYQYPLPGDLFPPDFKCSLKNTINPPSVPTISAKNMTLKQIVSLKPKVALQQNITSKPSIAVKQYVTLKHNITEKQNTTGKQR